MRTPIEAEVVKSYQAFILLCVPSWFLAPGKLEIPVSTLALYQLDNHMHNEAGDYVHNTTANLWINR